jgi:RNA polymerase subunit RPABC4/transcription elongation factor Spt4
MINIHKRKCRRCGRHYDMASCPYCNKERYGDSKVPSWDEVIKGK